MSWMSSVAGSSIEVGFAITDRSLRPDRFDDTARDFLEGKYMVKFRLLPGFLLGSTRRSGTSLPQAMKDAHDAHGLGGLKGDSGYSG